MLAAAPTLLEATRNPAGGCPQPCWWIPATLLMDARTPAGGCLPAQLSLCAASHLPPVLRPRAHTRTHTLQLSSKIDEAKAASDAIRADIAVLNTRLDSIKAARDRHDAGEIDDAELNAIEDAAIRDVVALQEDLGLEVITDGEFRRSTYSEFFTTTASPR